MIIKRKKNLGRRKISILNRSCFICFLFFILATSCLYKGGKKIVFINAKNNEIKIAADSVQYPEMSCFGVALTLTNNSSRKVLLTFDSINANGCSYQLGNFYLVTSRKDTFNLGIKEKYIILKEHSVKQIVLSGFISFQSETKIKGFFNSSVEIDTAFLLGNINYYFYNKIITNIDQDKLRIVADTFLIPSKLEVATKNVKFVEHIFLLPPTK